MSILNTLFGKGDKKPKDNRYRVYTYRTKDGKAYFKYSYHKTEKGYEIDIHEQPSYDNRDDNLYTTHRYSSSRDTQYKICIHEHKLPQTLDAAQKLSMAFAEYTWEYIKTNITIDAQIGLESKNRKK